VQQHWEKHTEWRSLFSIWRIGRPSGSAFPYLYRNNAFHSVEGELFAAFPDYATCITARQLRRDSTYYTCTASPLKMMALQSFAMSGTTHALFNTLGAVTLYDHRYDNFSTDGRARQHSHCYHLSDTAGSSNDCWGSAICEISSLLHPWKSRMSRFWFKHDGMIYRGVEVYLHAFLTLTLDVIVWSGSRTGCFRPGTHWQVADGPHSHSPYVLYKFTILWPRFPIHHSPTGPCNGSTLLSASYTLTIILQ
jgi:hypothetical protein